MSGLNNELNVLCALSIFNKILQGKAHKLPFIVNKNKYTYNYYLDDGIYLKYTICQILYISTRLKKKIDQNSTTSGKEGCRTGF